MQSFDSPLFLVNTGIHWDDTLWRYSIYHGDVGHNTGQAPASADTSGRDREIMEIDSTVLGR